jgi:hypothetical protein
MAGEQSKGRLGNLGQWASPWMQINLFFLVQPA